MNEELLNSPVTARSPGEQSTGRGGGMDEHGGADKGTVATTGEVKHMGNQGAGSVEHGSQPSLESLQQETRSAPGDMAAHSQELICGVTRTEKLGEGSAGSREGAGAPKDEPPEDWLEPLEEDDDDEDEDEDDDRQSWELDILPGQMHLNGRQEAELESLAGESERSGSLAGSERNFKKKSRSNSGVSAPRRRRRQNVADEEWEEWPVLGEGWKRKEVFRRSGFSVGKTDTYYMSPSGDRFRSKIELTKHLSGVMDLSTFDFKSGKFLDAVTYRKMRKRRRKKRDQSPINREQSVFSEVMGPVDRSYTPDALPGHLHGAGSQRLQPMSSLSSGSLQRSSTSSHSPYPFSTPPRSVQASPLQVDVAAQCPGNTTSVGPGKVTSLGCSAADMPSGEPPFHHLGPSEPGPSLVAGSPASTPERPYGANGQGQDSSWGVPGNPQQKLTVQHTLSPELMSLDPTVTVNGEGGRRNPTPDTLFSNCTKCGSPYPYADLNRMDQASLCPKCRSEKRPDNRNIIFRKWLPCGQCRACLVTEDCGMCASCRNGLLNPDSRKPVRCRRRKCLCPIRKKKAKDELETENMPIQLYSILQHSDSEDFSLFLDDDDDMEGGPKKRNRRSCGMCNACLHTTDCGSCDFCIDKPKFGGSNKKRQKCRLRQCQRQAMRHLLPFQLGKSEYLTPEGWVGLGRPRPHYQYGARRSRLQKPEASWDDVEFTDDENEEGYMGIFRPGFYGPVTEEDGGGLAQHSQNYVKTTSGRQEALKENGFAANVLMANQPSLSVSQEAVWAYDHVPQMTEKAGEGDSGKERASLDLDENMRVVEVDTGESRVQEVTPMITQIFSLADSAQTGVGTELPLNPELLQLLEDLRRAVLPVHWVGLMVEGPRLQLVQCSKLSTMADTVVQIEPGFHYQVSVQDQPLLLTHPLYEVHPSRLVSVAHVVSLLLDLERYAVCQGYPVTVPWAGLEPTSYVRAATCDFLVPRTKERCTKCSVAPLRL